MDNSGKINKKSVSYSSPVSEQSKGSLKTPSQSHAVQKAPPSSSAVQKIDSCVASSLPVALPQPTIQLQGISSAPPAGNHTQRLSSADLVTFKEAVLDEELDDFFEKNIVPEIIRCWKDLKTEALKPIQNIGQEIEAARAMFKNALQSSLPFIILGNGDVREDAKLVANVGILAAEPAQETIAKLEPGTLKKAHTLAFTHAKPPALSGGNERSILIISALTISAVQDLFFKKGSILADAEWSLLRNYMLILGGMLGGKEFHIAMPKGGDLTPDKFWSQRSNNIRVLGREIALLCYSGYQLHVVPKSKDLIYTKGENFKLLKLEDIIRKINSIKSPNEFLALFLKSIV